MSRKFKKHREFNYQLPVESASGEYSFRADESAIMFRLSLYANGLKDLTKVDEVHKLVSRIIAREKCEG